MSSRFAAIVATLGVTVLLFALLPVASATAASPWWQILDGSRPTNLWEPKSSEFEIETELGEFALLETEAMAANIEVGGTPVGCLGDPEVGSLLCELITGFPATSTAVQLDELLEQAWGTTAVEVTGGPVGGEPFKIKVDGGVPALALSPAINEEIFGPDAIGKATLKVLSEGGSGRLILTITNLGSAPVDATETPVTVVDELPEGVVATGVEAVAGYQGKGGPVDCSIEAADLVTCSFEGTVLPYEAIEIDVLASLTGAPPVAGAPGEVTVSGGNAPPASRLQEIVVSPEETPFGIERFSSQAEEGDGEPATRAGRQPFQLSTTIQFKAGAYVAAGNRRDSTVEQPALPRNLRFPLPAGLVGNATAIPRCAMSDFFESVSEGNCPADTAIGVAAVTIYDKNFLGFARIPVPVFNLPPKNGEPARFGINVLGTPALIDTAVDPDNQYRIIASVNNTTQVAKLLSSTVVIWGDPGDPDHDSARGWGCLQPEESPEPCERPQGLEEVGFLRQPVSCQGPLGFGAEAEPWNVPLGSVVDSASFDAAALHGCNQVTFHPEIAASPTTSSAVSSSGLEFRLDMPNPDLPIGEETAEGQAKKVEVTLPEGVTVNPSQAEGLGGCSPADLAKETASSPPGQGCPDSSKVGSVDIVTPLLEEEAHGSVYVAKPYDNPFDSLLALYMVAKVPERGILVKQAGKVELDPQTGQLVTTFDDLPQVPFESFELSFFGGSRAPLVLPPKCGSYDIVARFTPWHASDPDNPLPSEIVEEKTSFSVDQGPNGTPCPSGTPPFKPGFTAGTNNNAAGSYSPFTARLTRNDNEQEFSRLSMKFPKGVIGSIAGIPFCSDAAIAAAKARSGPNGGQEELDNPSCPSASQIGRILVGAGAGPALSYAPGKIYLAGPYQGSKLSIVVISTAKVGPFDLGTVVIRQALKVDSETAEVITDGASSEPIPHILQGVVVHARDIRVYVDRPNFIFNPTNCERMAASATVFGSGLDFGSLGDDQAVDVSAPFQAADCASLGFKPKLVISLKGKTRRGGSPALKAVLTTRSGDANFARAQVTLPKSEFVEQSHFRTICTRVQFRAGSGNGEQCPEDSIYGRARVQTPLLDETLKGPVFLRSSDNELPDVVIALHSPRADFNLVGRVDSINGRVRTTFEAPPDAPVSKLTLEMQGGSKSLFVNNTNICKAKPQAKVLFGAQNGRIRALQPVIKTSCKKKKGKKKRK